jgi:hypothetical protein
MTKTLKNRGGSGVLNWIFGKRMTSAERRKRSAEIREQRLANIPGTRQNREKQEKRRHTNRDIASPETRKLRLASLPGTAENIARQRERAAATRSNSGSRKNKKA